MALITARYRDGKECRLDNDASGGKVGWSMWHCMRFADAMKAEIGMTNWDESRSVFPDEYTFTHDHTFTEKEQYVWDRGGDFDVEYTLTIKKGDVYKCWRDS